MCWYVKDSPTLDFMYKMAKEPDLLEKFKQDPQAVMDEAGIPEEHQNILLTRNKDEILQHLAEDSR